MAIEIAQDPRFGDDPNFKFSIGWFEGKIQQLQSIMHIINAISSQQYTMIFLRSLD